MGEACYTARATTKQQVFDRIRKLTLQTKENGQYTHGAILLLQRGIRRVLQSQFNPSDPSKGMEKLLDTGDNRLTLAMSTDAITVGFVIKKAKLHAKSLTTSTGKPSSPPSPHEWRHRRKPINSSEAAPCSLQPCYFAKWDIFADTSDYQYVMGFPVCILNNFLPIFPISCHLLMSE